MLVPCGGLPVADLAISGWWTSTGDQRKRIKAVLKSACSCSFERTRAPHGRAGSASPVWEDSSTSPPQAGEDLRKKEIDLLEGPEITFAEAVLDNGRFGTRTIRFETGRLAQQAQGAVAAYLDEETMLLSATSAGKHPREGFDFFPLTVDVEERSYAAGKIPGSFFRREGRPSTEAILVCRLIDRPLRPSFVDGLRNEV